MAKFVGSAVSITLAGPHSPKIRGLIVSVSEGRLTLTKVKWLSTGTVQELLVIDGQNILDLDIEPESPPHAPASLLCSDPVVDPAILSYARPSSAGQISALSQVNVRPNHPPGPPHPPISPVQSLHRFPQKPRVQANGPVVAPDGPEPSAILTEPFNALSINGHVETCESSTVTGRIVGIARPEDQDDGLMKGGDKAQTTRSKRTRRKKPASKDSKTNGLIQAMPLLPSPPEAAQRLAPKAAIGSGWRETPLMEIGESATTNPPQLPEDLKVQASIDQLQVPAYTNAKASKKSRKNRSSEYDDQGGWATGEATDIQDMGDFDFEANHKKFDKKKVFEQIRQEDTTADEARLVSFNRLPARPGTYGGKNLHFTENVLDSPTRNVAQHSSDSDSHAGEGQNGRGRVTRRPSSKLSQQKVSSRKGSTYIDPEGGLIGLSMVPDARSDKHQRGSFEAPVSSNPSLRSHKSSSQRRKPRIQTAASDLRCPHVTPLQMLELEQLAVTELGMTEDMMTENAATAIARTARQIPVVTNGRQSRTNHGRNPYPLAPLIVVLAGNHKTGSRAIAAARHLLNHSAQVVLCVLGLEQEANLLESVRRQLSIFRKCGGHAVQQSQLMDTLKGISTSDAKRQDQPTTIKCIVDALLGIHLSIEDLKLDHQHAYSQLVHWANTCHVTTISIDVPSGVDSSTGATPNLSHVHRLKAEASRTGVVLQSEPELVVEAHHVLSLGAPKIGLVLGKKSVTAFHQNHHSWLVADIGLGDTVWKKSGLHGGHGVDFGSEWVTTLGFVSEPES